MVFVAFPVECPYFFFISSMKPLATNATMMITMMAMITPMTHGSICIPKSSIENSFAPGAHHIRMRTYDSVHVVAHGSTRDNRLSGKLKLLPYEVSSSMSKESGPSMRQV